MVLKMILKICNFKKQIGIESEKVRKQVKDQMVWKQVEDTAQGLIAIEWKYILKHLLSLF